MNNLPTLKKYEIDYDFIIKNYLNPEMWEKTWTLFQYKTFVVTLCLSYINCQNEKIFFNIKIKDNSTKNYMYDWGENRDKDSSESAEYSLKINDVSFLKKEIEKKVLVCLEYLEKQYIKGLDEFYSLKNEIKKEEINLRNIAENFLDENQVTNDEIREVYINNYIDYNAQLEKYKDEFISNSLYTYFTDFYLTFANSTKNETIINLYNEKTSKTSNIEEIKKQVNEYLQYMQTEECMDDLNSNLEEI